MKERPILFSAPMVRALLAGTKTQTRRIVKLREFQPTTPSGAGWDWDFRDDRGRWNSYTTQQLVASTRNRYGAPGDRLWVRETFCAAHPDETGESGRQWFYAASDDYVICVDDRFTESGQERSPWKPSIHMPRAASRIDLEVTGVRVERLQAISEDDAEAEGVSRSGIALTVGMAYEETHRQAYERLWGTINGAGSWDANPWVWVVEFKRVPT